jgi:hypothetical protein
MDSRTGRVSGAGDALVRRAKTAPVLTKYVYYASARERLDHFDSVHKKWPISAMWKCKMGETKCKQNAGCHRGTICGNLAQFNMHQAPIRFMKLLCAPTI